MGFSGERSRRRGGGLAVLAAVLAAVSTLLVACGAPGAPAAPPPAPATTVPPPTIVVPTLARQPQPWPPRLELAAARVARPLEAPADVPGREGDCVTLSGVASTDVALAACGSPDATHKVVARTTDARRCSPDVDVVFDTTQALLQRTDGRGKAVLCLDVDWAPGQCYSFSLLGPFGERSPCVEPSSFSALGEQVVRAADRVEGTTDAAVCASAAVVHSVRKIVQCLERPTA